MQFVLQVFLPWIVFTFQLRGFSSGDKWTQCETNKGESKKHGRWPKTPHGRGRRSVTKPNIWLSPWLHPAGRALENINIDIILWIRGWWSFSRNIQIVNHLGFSGHADSVPMGQLFGCSRKAVVGTMYVNGYVYTSEKGQWASLTHGLQ